VLEIFTVTLSGFIYAVWAVAMFYQYHVKHSDDGHKSDQRV